MRLKNRTAKISFDIPENCDPEDVARFIQDALTSWGGQFSPEHPLFDSLDVHSIEFGGVHYVQEYK